MDIIVEKNNGQFLESLDMDLVHPCPEIWFKLYFIGHTKGIDRINNNLYRSTISVVS